MRVEKEDSIAQLEKKIDDLTNQVSEQSRRARRKRNSRSFFILIVLFVLAFAGVYVGVLVQKAGVVRVPVVHRFVDSEVAPTRLVEERVDQEMFLSAFSSESDINMQALAEAFLQGNNLDKQLSLSEVQLTGSLRAFLTSRASERFDAEQAQVVVEDEFLEVFLPFKDSVFKSGLLIRLNELRIDQTELAADVERVHIGTLQIPRVVGRLFLGTALNAVAQAQKFNPLFQIEEIYTESGVVLIMVHESIL